MRPGAALQAETDARLEQFRAPDRERARKRMLAGDDLSPYDIDVLGGEYVEHLRAEQRRRAQEAATRQQREAVADVVRPKNFVWPSTLMERCCEHIIDLCVEHRISVRSQRDGGGKCWTETSTIAIPPISNFETYAIALHEVGHAIDPDADSRRHPHMITKDAMISARGEVASWRFAVKTAIVWQRSMQNRLQQSLVHYSAYGERDDRELMTALVRDAALKIVDSPLRFNELDAVCKSIEGPLSNPAHVQTVPPETIVPRTDGTLDLKVTYDGERTVTLCSKDGTPIEGGVLVFPVTIYRGVFEAGRAYAKGDSVTFRGSTWTARDATSATPGIGATPWQLSTKAGRDAR